LKERMLVINVNGKDYRLKVDPGRRLVDVLRQDLRLWGTKEGCRTGNCGACTVLLDYQAVCSCMTLVGQVRGRRVTTIEGLGNGKELDPLQEAFMEHGAVQCGYCTPGILLSARALLSTNPHPTDEEIRTAIAGNLCRCTGYGRIIRAIQAVAEAAETVCPLASGAVEATGL
jgi:aerobic-type carbon monoxide dehydrogenase small subunit (CoxS/CutS family)